MYYTVQELFLNIDNINDSLQFRIVKNLSIGHNMYLETFLFRHIGSSKIPDF